MKHGLEDYRPQQTDVQTHSFLGGVYNLVIFRGSVLTRLHSPF